MMQTHRIPGLGPTPLLSYLAALGLAKTLTEQADPKLRFGWRNGVFLLTTSVDDIAAFLVDRYRPTPVLSPWNGGSGFGDKDKAPKEFLKRIEQSTDDRLATFRDAIRAIREVLSLPQASLWRSDKARLVQELRNRLPDESLGWLDASVVLTSEGPSYPPLLGTGGNDGRLDFSTNFHQRLFEVLPELGARKDRSLALATDMLQRTTTVPVVSAAVGQSDPSGAAGPGSSAFGSADSLVNPWEYLLMLEGSTLFAASTTKRLGGRGGRSAVPFTIRHSPEGPHAGAAGEDARGELWAPIFEEISLQHFVQVLNEARATWDGGSAESVPAMYGAIHTYGIDRGISSFQRFGFLKRNGLAFVAAPLDSVTVSHRPEVAAAQNPLRRASVFKQASGAASEQAGRRFDAAATAFLRDPSAVSAVRMLRAQTLLEIVALRSDSNRESLRRAIGLVQPRQILPVLRELLQASPEARIAAGIASARALTPAGSRTIRTLLVGSDPGRDPESAVIGGLGQRPIIDVLADLMVWLAQHPGTDHGSAYGWLPWSTHRFLTRWQDVHAWAGSKLNDALVRDYLLAFLAIDWNSECATGVLPGLEPVHVDPALALFQALASGKVRMTKDPGAEPMGMDPSWAIQLRANHVAAAQRGAAALVRRGAVLTREGPQTFAPLVGDGATPPQNQGRRILAALTAPASTRALTVICPTIQLPPTAEGELS